MTKRNAPPVVEVWDWPAPHAQHCSIGKSRYAVARLIAKADAEDLPVFDAPVAALDLETPSSWGSGSMIDFVVHMRAVLAADTDFPILLDGDGSVLDGRHRIAKAIHEGRATLPARRFQYMVAPDSGSSDD